MTVSSASNATAASSSSSAASATSNAQATFGQNYNDFLTLLTTQLQNQDPTSPTDTAQFTNQLVLFSGVEQQINTNSQLATLNTTAQQITANTASLAIGTTATGSSNQFTTTGGGAPTTLTYTLPSAASTAYVTIQDSNGNNIASLSGGTAAGSNSVVWDGLETNGTAAPAGTYTMNVTAMGSNNTAITATTTTTGTVTGVNVLNGATILDLGNIQMNLGDVTSLTEASASSSTGN